LYNNDTPEKFFVFVLFPQEWRKELKLNGASIYGNTQYQNLSGFPATLCVDGKKVFREALFKIIVPDFCL